MKAQPFPSIKLLSIMLVVSLACGGTQITPPPEPATSSPPQAPIQTDTPIPPVEIQPADLIFFNGNLITIEKSQPLAQAIAIRGGRIQAVGTNDEILAYQSADTVTVDLQGRTLMPGFVDGHSHTLAFPDRMGRSFEEAQETAIRYGITTVNEMWANQGYLESLMQAEEENRLRLRVNLFPSYNDGVLDGNRKTILLKTWFPDNPPIFDPARRLRIPGIKIFVDGDVSAARGCWMLGEPYLSDSPALQNGYCGTERGDLYLPQAELNKVVSQAQKAGYRVAFHSMGDGAIETVLNAIEHALDGQPNSAHRHQIHHSSLLRPELLTRYEELDIVAAVRGYGDFCNFGFLEPYFGIERTAWYANRYAIPNLNIHSYVEIDFGWTVEPDDRYSQRSLDPLMQLYGIVTHRFVDRDGTACEPDPLVMKHRISVERALQMLTVEAAYAVSMEDHIGSLKPGKYADLTMLSDDPLSIHPDSLRDLEVWMTMVEGKIEYCAEEQEDLCTGKQDAASAPPPDLPASGNLAVNRSTTASNSLPDKPPRFAVDGDESTHWASGDGPTQWIEVDLGAPATATEIRLLPSQYPEGNTLHVLSVRGESGVFTEIHRFAQFTRDNDWLVFEPGTPLENVRFLRIETLESPSWVSWFEVQVIGTR
jgi:predicted amidohydrolase YtcJ